MGSDPSSAQRWPRHHPAPPQPSPGLVYRGQVLFGVVSHVHLGYTRCLCRGLRRTGQDTASPTLPNLCRPWEQKRGARGGGAGLHFHMRQ